MKCTCCNSSSAPLHLMSYESSAAYNFGIFVNLIRWHCHLVIIIFLFVKDKERKEMEGFVYTSDLMEHWRTKMLILTD